MRIMEGLTHMMVPARTSMASTPNLQRKLQQTLGAEAAGDLIAWMQSMDGNRSDILDLRRDMQAVQADIHAMKLDVSDLRREMQVGFARVDGRIDTLQAGMERTLEKAMREQTRFFFLAWAVLLAAFIGLYAKG